MPIYSIGKLLGATEELKALSAHVRRLRELQTLYLETAPRELATASRVRDYRAGTLVIAAEHAAIAAKLRQIAPRLLTAIKKAEPQVNSVRIEVQVSGDSPPAAPAAEKTSLTVDAIDKFEELAEALPRGALKSALTNLVRRRR